jgi:hypothetical protein
MKEIETKSSRTNKNYNTSEIRAHSHWYTQIMYNVRDISTRTYARMCVRARTGTVLTKNEILNIIRLNRRFYSK